MTGFQGISSDITGKEKPQILFRNWGLGLYQTSLNYILVEAAPIKYLPKMPVK